MMEFDILFEKIIPVDDKLLQYARNKGYFIIAWQGGSDYNIPEHRPAHFSENESVAMKYGQPVRKFLLMMKKPYIVSESYYESGGDSETYISDDDLHNMDDQLLELIENIKDEGYDGIIGTHQISYGIPGGGIEYVVFDPSHIKLADRNTYNDNGDLIPLEQRFDHNSNDVRY